MAVKANKALRCAIYTRKSTEHGLELEFNSLDAQREACEAYIKSQAAEGWRALSQRYDDPAYSGGNMERPALKRLLKDIDSGLIDVIVVYKIDRLTRALADFAKLVELFDAKSVSFVAITQQFNTTTSMGRLTLNVLLSFAQFERELSSERVRDKIAASRKKGKWTGGTIPLGYDCKDKKLVVNPREAKLVRMIFSRYLALKSFQRLVDELDHNGVVTKTRQVKGKVVGGVPFTYGPLAYLLKSRTYLGETGYKDSWFAGEHEPIIDRKLFDEVQQLLKTNSIERVHRRRESGALLAGFLFDDRGNRMSPSFSVKRGARYPFYVSSALLRGRKAEAGSVTRASATMIEDHVLKALRAVAKNLESDTAVTLRDAIENFVDRIIVTSSKLVISLKSTESGIGETLEVPWSKQKRSDLSRIEQVGKDTKPSPNPLLVQAIARAHSWVRLLTDGTYETVEDLAQSVRLHPKIVRKGLRLAFLAPDVTRAILHGEHAAALSLADLNDTTAYSWREQSRALGFETARH